MKISDSLIHFSSRHASQNSDQSEETRTEEQVVRKDRIQSPADTTPGRNTILVDRVNISVDAKREYESQYSALQSSRATVTGAAGEILEEFDQTKNRDKLPEMDPENRYKMVPSWKYSDGINAAPGGEPGNLGQVGDGPVLRVGSILGKLEPGESSPAGTGTLVGTLVGAVTGIEMTGVSLSAGTPLSLESIGSGVYLGQSLDRSDFVSWSPDLGQPAETLVTINTKNIHHEAEQLEISSAGTVTTQDGRTIDFAMEIAMNREFLSEEQQETITHTFQELIDPLTISLDGSVTQLTDTRFEFDLDNDGDTEQISFVSKGSGFLSFDFNGDGIINNGSELFGPGTGNGFGELGEYDTDKNGWIDENDAVFEKLSIWTRDDQGNDQLISLKDAGVGAIYLDNAQADFEMKAADNELHGRLRRSGVFLFENGNVGSIQQIDLADRSGNIRPVEGSRRYITEA